MIWQELWLIQEKHEPILGDVRCALKHLKTEPHVLMLLVSITYNHQSVY